MFIDRQTIIIKSGNGGDGVTSFIRYKGVSNGGPDGGDGGKGGSVYFVGDKHKSSLIDFKFRKKFAAGDGGKGGAKRCKGVDGEDIVIPVPTGTVVRDRESGKIICDVYYDGEKKLVLEGGRGGKGNARFCTSRRHAPHFSQKGETTVQRRVTLELKTIADVGIIGFPNAGKSTLLSKITAAKPKIANYQFTTLSPNLGVVTRYDESFTVADVPGLIEGAAEGAGLGHEFLRHIERTRLLIHVVDLSASDGRDPAGDYEKINAELKKYSEELSLRPQIVVANKCDVYGATDSLEALQKAVGDKKIFLVSALTGEGIDALMDEVFAAFKALPESGPIEAEEFRYYRPSDDEFSVERDEDGAFVVIGALVDLLVRNVVLSDADSLAYMQKTLREKGVIKALKDLGIKDGDTVVIGETEFEFFD